MNTFNLELQSTQATIASEESHDEVIKFQLPLSRELIPILSGKMEFQWYDKSDKCKHSPSTYPTFASYCGIKNLKSLDELSDLQVSIELDVVRKILLEKTLTIETMTGVDDREMYRFITQEFLNMQMCGTLIDSEHRYIYEEFHSNVEYRIKKTCSNFLRSFFGLHLYPNAYKEWKNILENYRQLKHFRNEIVEFYDVEITFETLIFTAEGAFLDFNLSYAALHNDHVIISKYNAIGKCLLRKEKDYYLLYKVSFPGLEHFW